MYHHRIEEAVTEPRYQKDKFRLAQMEVGDSWFHYGFPQNYVAPYVTYANRTTGKKFRTSKGKQRGRDGVVITRVK